jgi:exonuclease III
MRRTAVNAKFLFLSLMNSNMFIWNSRGAASPAFHRNCKQYIDKHKPCLVVIMETRTSPVNLQRTFQLLGFDGYHFAETNGYTGGIIVAWKKESIGVDLLYTHFQFLHLKVTLQAGKIFFLTTVYASPHEEGRNALWREIKHISRDMTGEWLLVGDFNDIMKPSEKKGGVPASQRQCDKFVDRINECQLLDCGAIGPQFTWYGPKFHGGDRIFERLDRALANDDWRIGFPNAVVKVLPRVTFSDHHPLLIQLLGSGIFQRARTFKFESAWLLDSSYEEMWKSWWKDTTPITQLVHITQALQEWRDITLERVTQKKENCCPGWVAFNEESWVFGLMTKMFCSKWLMTSTGAFRKRRD